MFRFVPEATNSVIDVFFGKGGESGFVATDQKFGECGAGRDGGGTATGFVTRFGHGPGLHADGKAQDIAADWVRNFNCGGGGGKIAHVAWITEVLNQFGSHVCKNQST